MRAQQERNGAGQGMAYSFVAWHDHVRTQFQYDVSGCSMGWSTQGGGCCTNSRVTGTEWPMRVHISPACAVHLCVPRAGPHRAADAAPRGAAWGAPTAPATAGRRRTARRRHARHYPGHLRHRGPLWHAGWGLHAQEGGRRIWEGVYADGINGKRVCRRRQMQSGAVSGTHCRRVRSTGGGLRLKRTMKPPVSHLNPELLH